MRKSELMKDPRFTNQIRKLAPVKYRFRDSAEAEFNGVKMRKSELRNNSEIANQRKRFIIRMDIGLQGKNKLGVDGLYNLI